jgi:hypothetical protein
MDEADMKNISTLLTDIWRTYMTGARNRDKTVIGFIAMVIISIALIVAGLLKT